MQLKDRSRIEKYGEVFTSAREVNEIIDLFHHETIRIESKFFEPACGNGNFLTEILNRKLMVIKNKYSKNQSDYERALIVIVGSLYGIDILEDNVVECRVRLTNVSCNAYKMLYKKKAGSSITAIVQFIIKKNILWGNALTLTTMAKKQKPLVISDWTFINSYQLKRRDYLLSGLLEKNAMSQAVSEEGSTQYFPTPIKEYRKTHYLEILNSDES
jgi:hypothetical protein